MMMIEYNNQIRNIEHPTFQKIRSIAKASISNITKEQHDELYARLKRGEALLSTHEEMCQYLCSFGNMHEAKMKFALGQMSVDLFKFDFSVVDWGCGQGLATVCFLDYLKEKKITSKIQNVILIEPSKTALERAVLHVNAYLKDLSKIVSIPKYLNDINENEIKTNGEHPVFHFFSNILDIEAIDLKELAKTLSNSVSNDNYLFCISPLNAGNERIDAFYNYFNAPELFVEDRNSQYDYGKKSTCTFNIKVFKLEYDIKGNVIPVEYYPAVQFHAGYQLDCVKEILSELSSEEQLQLAGLQNNLTSFETSTPFDIGASVYDDVHSILAVLNNIITRGLPTKASPFVERVFATAFEKSIEKNDNGVISFMANTDGKLAEDLFLAMHLIDPRFTIDDTTYNCNKLDSELEKKFIVDVAHPILRQILLPQRSLRSITSNKEDYAQRVDFAVEFPYNTANGYKGATIEVDGKDYHCDALQMEKDKLRDSNINNSKWKCTRIIEENILKRTKIDFSDSDFITKINNAFNKPFDANWKQSLQLVLSPIAIARVQKVILEALMTDKLSLEQETWKILVDEKDVPCASIAFKDIEEIFNNLTQLSLDYQNLKFPKVELEIISTREFCDSPLHLNIKPTLNINQNHENKIYDLVIDISVLRRSEIENITFTNFKSQNHCYFNIRSSHYQRSVRKIYTSDRISYHNLVHKDIQGRYKEIEDNRKLLQYFMQLIFRKEDFRPGQLPILNRALRNKCVIGLLPTGGGKSLTYQLAAMLQPGVTIVVDPLRSLMKDQFDGLINAGIDCCSFINSSISAEEKEARERKMESSELLFIFLSPERLCIYKFRERLKNMHELNVYFSYGVIDEVHCVSEWGHDFRFSYLHLGRNLYKYVRAKEGEISLFGLTATASFDVLADVERELSGNGAFDLDADTIVRYENTNRLELQYRIEKVDVPFGPVPWSVYEEKNNYISTYISKISDYVEDLQSDESISRIKQSFIDRENLNLEDDSELYKSIINADLKVNILDDWHHPKEKHESAGIVFCPHRSGNIGVSDSLRKRGLSSAIKNDLNCNSIGTFMGGDDMCDQDSFLQNNLSIMVATNAFGMGIDKPNVRFTINVNHSSSIESFVQEAGRAGRDRKMAIATILYSDFMNVDLNVVMHFHSKNFQGPVIEKSIMHNLLSNDVVSVFFCNEFEDSQLKQNVSGFLKSVLEAKEDQNIVSIISYLKNNKDEQKEYQENISKAIYRMTCIGLINDFTEDYTNKRFRIVSKRKVEGSYFNGLRDFLLRYYTNDKADAELNIAKEYQLLIVSENNLENEIHRCLGYLTSFVYEKIAIKRKRAIDDMQTFCIQGSDESKDWKERNEDLKDFIYYYFNSKYAKTDYESDNGESFSLTKDTDYGKKSSKDTVFRFMKVIDDQYLGAGGVPKNNVKHLQGAVRLIRRSSDDNPTLSLLNAFCLFYLGTNNNENLEIDLIRSYKEGMIGFEKDIVDPVEFWTLFNDYNETLISFSDSNQLTKLQTEVMIIIHSNKIKNITDKYIQ